jgi:DNA replication protein DnaC
MTKSLLILILLLVTLACLLYILYLKIFKSYTRERFAFAGLSAILTLFSTFLLQIYSSQGYISACIDVSNFVFDTRLTTYTTDIKDHIITLIALSIITRFILSVHRNWDGPISEIAFQKERFQEQQTLLSEAILQLKDFLSKQKVIYRHADVNSQDHFNVFIPQEEDKMPWHEHVFELLTFPNKQYKIDFVHDYYPDEKCFISKYGQNDDIIAILCALDFPNDSTIRNFLLFAKRQKKSISKFIVAARNIRGDIYKTTKYETELIIRNEEEMLNSLVDFSQYKNFVEEQFEKKEITQGNKLTLKDVYVPMASTIDAEIKIENIEEYIFSWLRDEINNKHLAILGEYGCGKSVLSLKLTYELLQSQTNWNRIPILIELRGKSPRNLNVNELISTWSVSHRIDPASILKLHKAGKLLIIFEGFDEMDMIGDREMRLNHFQRLWEFAIAKSKIIITGRPNFFLDDNELKTNLGIGKADGASHFCEAIHLAKFDIDKIKIALRNADGSSKNQIIEILENFKNPNFYDLVSRPSILYLVSVIWKESKLSQIRDRINSAIVIQEFIRYTYARQTGKNAKFPLTEKEREYFMLGVAVRMFWQSEFSNQIDKISLESVINKLFETFPNDVSMSGTAIQSKGKGLKARMRDNVHANESILTDVRSCGILVNELSRNGYFKFAHKSFLEYLVSFYFVESLSRSKDDYNIMVNSISRGLEIDISNFRLSHETVVFIAEILVSKLPPEKDEPEIVARKLFSELCLVKSLKKYPYILSFIDLYLVGIVLFVLMPVIILFVFFEVNNLFTFFSIVLIQVMLGYYLSIFRRNRDRLRIWLKCCDQLFISQDIVTRMTHKSYPSFINGKTDGLPRHLIFIISLGEALSKAIRGKTPVDVGQK